MIDIVRLLLDKPWVAFLALVVAFVLGLIFENFQDEYKIFKLLAKYCLVTTKSFLVLGVVFFSIHIVAPRRPVSNNEWVEIYQNDLGAKVELDFQDYKEYYHFALAGTHDESLKSLSETAARNKAVRNIKLTVKTKYEEIQKVVVLDKNNIIQNYDDLNNVKISKLEYRKIDGLALEYFGIYGSPQATDEIGEIRITLESSEDQELRKVFGQ